MQPESLIGKQLRDGWTIEGRREFSPHATGGRHSLGYIAKHPDGRQAFIKLLDPTLNRDAPDPLDDLRLRIEVFQYEQKLVEKCQRQRMSRVVRAIDAGELTDDLDSNPIYYLTFELAECDLREQADLERRFDLAFRMRVLHQASVGLQQLHWAQIALQDLKPSNVLIFSDNKTKLGDLGHAHELGNPRPGPVRVIAADPTYAPPEQLYSHIPEDWGTRRLSADLYQLGSLAVFLFAGVGITSLLSGQLRPEHHWDVWMGEYQDVLPYLREATDAALDELATATETTVREELVQLVRYLTEPEPTRRGHPKNIAGNGATFGIHRFVSRFNVLATRAEFELRKKLSA